MTIRVNISKVTKWFEEIPNVKVLDIWKHRDFDKYAGAIILIDDEKLLIFDYFTERSFLDNKGIVRIIRIANWDIVTKCYGYNNVISFNGEPIKSYRFIFGLNFHEMKCFIQNNNLPDINKIQDVIENYDLILNIIDSLQEYTEESKNWNEYHDLENDMIYWISKEKAEPFIYEVENNFHNLSKYIIYY